MSAKISKQLFYLLSCTWGLPLTFLGMIVSLVLLCTGHKPKKWNYCYYFEVGSNWGGFELGMFFVKDTTYSEHIMNHEHGHGIQNCYFGPLMLPIITIPSVIRYWYREYLNKVKKIKYSSMPQYDSIWFEGSATRLGTELTAHIREGNTK